MYRIRSQVEASSLSLDAAVATRMTMHSGFHLEKDANGVISVVSDKTGVPILSNIRLPRDMRMQEKLPRVTQVFVSRHNDSKNMYAIEVYLQGEE